MNENQTMTAARRKIIPDPCHRLAELVDGLRADTLDAQARAQLADMLERAACERRPGERSWTTVIALRERDRLLRLAARQLAPDAPKAEQARELHVALLRYASTVWRRERAALDCPDRHVGAVEALLWRALRVHDRVLSASALRAILSVPTS